MTRNSEWNRSQDGTEKEAGLYREEPGGFSGTGIIEGKEQN